MSSIPYNPTVSRYKSFCDTNEEHHSLSKLVSTDRIPDRSATMMNSITDDSPLPTDSALICCCGKSDCLYLEHNALALGSIERDLEKAAKLGQALLSRHESYISESQLEQARLNGQIADLEADRNSLQGANEKIVAENRQLLTQLESLNSAYATTNDQVKNLEQLLGDCEKEIKRLHNLTWRAEELEAQVLDLGRQRDALARKVEDGEQENRSTLLRWRESERKLKELEMEVQRIEWEAKRDREKHEETVAKLEREKELGGVEGRLKGATAFNGVGISGNNSNVISHFVRDILQDNANLQAGIVELRELLQVSNDEVQNLRSHVLQHQPIEVLSPHEEQTQLVPLDQELGWDQAPPQPQRDVHVHHHYHAQFTPKRERVSSVRRSARKKSHIASTAQGFILEPSIPPTPNLGMHYLNPSSDLSSKPRTLQSKKRWSTQSTATMSSVFSSMPSSPRSHYDKNNSIFDRIELGEESSRPTSPESTYGSVPSFWESRNHKAHRAEARLDTFEEAMEDPETPTAASNDLSTGFKIISYKSDTVTNKDTVLHDLTPKPSQVLQTVNANGTHALSSDLMGKFSAQSPLTEAIAPGVDVAQGLDADPVTISSLSTPKQANPLPDAETIRARPTLRHSSSHDSLVSISGMDIHIHSRVSRRPGLNDSSSPFALLRGNAAHFARAPSSARTTSTGAARAVTEITELTALPSIQLGTFAESATRSTSRSVSASVEALNGIAGLSSNIPPVPSIPEGHANGLGKLVGGWVRGKWGIAPTRSDTKPTPRTSVPNEQQSSTATQESAQRPPPVPITPSAKRTGSLNGSIDGKQTNSSASFGTSMSFMGSRTPGVNQRGAIPGFWIPTRATSELQPRLLDEEGLREGLAE